MTISQVYTVCRSSKDFVNYTLIAQTLDENSKLSGLHTGTFQICLEKCLRIT